MTSTLKIFKKKMLLLIRKMLMIDITYQQWVHIQTYSFYNQNAEPNIIQLVVIPFCRASKVAHDTKTTLKSYLSSDNPNRFSLSNCQQVFINFRKIEYFGFRKFIINMTYDNLSVNSNSSYMPSNKFLDSFLCSNNCINITKTSMLFPEFL